MNLTKNKKEKLFCRSASSVIFLSQKNVWLHLVFAYRAHAGRNARAPTEEPVPFSNADADQNGFLPERNVRFPC